MKEIFKMGSKLFVKLIIVNIMCFFVVISLSVLSTAVFTKNIGYKAYGTTSDSSESKELYEYYYADGDDTQKSEYEDQGYKVTESKIRSEISSSGYKAFLIVSQIFCIMILIAFVYPDIWQLGTKDSNLVHFKHKKEDKLKGLKIGLTATVPSILFYIFIVISRFTALKTFPTALYKFLNSSKYSFIDAITKGVASVGDLSAIKMLLLALLIVIVPLISYIAYLLGYKNFSIMEKLIYKKK